jgi:hypothetical protein
LLVHELLRVDAGLFTAGVFTARFFVPRLLAPMLLALRFHGRFVAGLCLHRHGGLGRMLAHVFVA